MALEKPEKVFHNKSMKKYFITLSLLCCVSISFAQKELVDGAKNIIRTEKNMVRGGRNVENTIKKATRGREGVEAVTKGITDPGITNPTVSSPQVSITPILDENLRKAKESAENVRKLKEATERAVAQSAPRSLSRQELQRWCVKIGMPAEEVILRSNEQLQAFLQEKGFNVQIAAPVQEERYVSPLAAFLEKEPEYTSWTRTEDPDRWVNRAAAKKNASAVQSLESLETECLANGMLREQIDMISPTERRAKLQEWLTTYKAMKEGWQGPSRYEDVMREGKLSAGEVEGGEIAWLREQPEFQAVKDNYIKGHYQKPFNPQVTSMRILAVNDIAAEIAPLQEAARQNGRVTVDVMPTISSALSALEKAATQNQPYDIVLLDYHGLQGKASDLSMWIYNNSKVSAPVVFYSAANSMPEILFKFNIIGSIDVAATEKEAHEVLNYASNLVMRVRSKTLPDGPSVHDRIGDNVILGEGIINQLHSLQRWVESQPDYFEDNYVEEEEINGRIKLNYNEPFNSSVQSMRVLVVRDDFFGVEQLREAAEKYSGVTIQQVFNAKDAMELLSQEHYDVVLTDYVLDQGNGFQVAMNIWNKKLNIPVISFSGFNMSPHTLISHNLVGSFPIITFPDEGEKLINYLSNIVATGKAYPNK